MARANFKIKVGSYAGNSTYRQITGVGFQPDFLIVVPSNASSSSIKDTLGQDIQTQFWSGAEDVTGNYVRGFIPDGFTVSAASGANNTGVNYYYVAFKGANNVLGTGIYMGTGVSKNVIDAERMDFTPKFAWVRGMATIASSFQCSDIHAATESQQFSSIALTTSGNFTGMLANGFGIGNFTGTNQSGTSYRYIALTNQLPPTVFKAGTYTGTGAAQTINGVGFAPDLLWIKSTGTTAGGESPALYVSTFPSGQAKRINAIALTTDIITSTHSDGFTVGTQAGVSESGDTFQYVAFKAGEFIVPVTRTSI